MSNVKIEVIKTEEGVLSWYPELKKVPLVGVQPKDLLVGCLTGKLVMILGYIDDKEVGLGVVERSGDIMNLLAVSAKNNARKLMGAFYSWARSLGCTKVTMMSTFDRKSYEKLFLVKHVTSVYEKDLIE